MSNLSAKGVTKVYGLKPVFNNITLNLNPGDRVVLVGENGAGKTTLLRILAGVEEPSKGTVTFSERMPRVYLAQEFDGDANQTGAEFIGSEKAQRSAQRMLDELDMPVSLLQLSMTLMSGGQRKILQLIKALISKAPYLLLDEPENHLDYFAREWLITTLNEYRGCIVFVSHDQYVIDNVGNKIVEIQDGSLAVYGGNYQFFLEEKARQMNGRLSEWEHMRREIERHKKMVERLRPIAKMTAKVAGHYRDKKRKLGELIAQQTARPRIERPKMKLSIGAVDPKNSKRILKLSDVMLKLGNKSLFYHASAELFFGEKVCLLGRNGSGKTSLIRMIQEKLSPDSGIVKIGVDVEVGYFSQEHYEELDPDATPLEEIEMIVHGGEQRARSHLNNFLIDSTAATRPISTLSGGQKTRLRFAKLFARNIEFLVLDEPTNHLDTLSWQVLLEAIKAFKGTVLLVSHDRAFVDEAVEKLWVINNSEIKEFSGNISAFLGE